jgi:MoxR-like ATPase
MATKAQSPKGALLVCGEPGSGKTEWIRSQAKLHKAKLFRWNTRIDRSLREGREVLHQQVRARDTMYVWLEGADDSSHRRHRHFFVEFLRRPLPDNMRIGGAGALEVIASYSEPLYNCKYVVQDVVQEE